jgi:hypothetical protein
MVTMGHDPRADPRADTDVASELLEAVGHLYKDGRGSVTRACAGGEVGVKFLERDPTGSLLCRAETAFGQIHDRYPAEIDRLLHVLD